jgi:ABC-type polysaccharide/polyol phosphate export permease
MKSLWLLTIKNLKLLLRSRSSALIIIFAPLLIILLLGLSYNNSAQFGLKIGVHANSFTEDVESFIGLLEEDEFTIFRYENDLENCKNDIKRSVVHTCIELPESLEIDDNEQKILTFHIDPSRVNIVWMVQETVQSKFNLKSQEISQELSGGILSLLLKTREVIANEENNINVIKEKTNSATSSADSAKTTLDGTELASEDSTIEKIDEIDTALAEAKQAISDARVGVNSAGITDQEKQDSIKADLNQAKKSIDSVGGGNDTGLLFEISTLIESAASAIDSTTTNLDSIKSSLGEANNAINALQTSLGDTRAKLESQSVTDADTISSPFVTKVERVSQESTYLNYLFPALLVLVVMFSSLLLGTTLVMIEKNSPAFLRNFFLPVRKINFIVSIYLTNVVLNLIEISVILGISLFFLKSSLTVLPLVGLILFIAGSVFTFLGMAIGYIFMSEETGVLASISLGSILLFTSGILLPLEGIAPFLREIIVYNPFVVAEKLVREIFIFNASLDLVAFELGILLAYAIILFFIIWLIESVLHKQLSQRFLRKHHGISRKKKKKKKE